MREEVTAEGAFVLAGRAKFGEDGSNIPPRSASFKMEGIYVPLSLTYMNDDGTMHHEMLGPPNLDWDALTAPPINTDPWPEPESEPETAPAPSTFSPPQPMSARAQPLSPSVFWGSDSPSTMSTEPSMLSLGPQASIATTTSSTSTSSHTPPNLGGNWKNHDVFLSDYMEVDEEDKENEDEDDNKDDKKDKKDEKEDMPDDKLSAEQDIPRSQPKKGGKKRRQTTEPDQAPTKLRRSGRMRFQTLPFLS